MMWRITTGALWRMRYESIHRDLNIRTIKEEIAIVIQKYVAKLHFGLRNKSNASDVERFTTLIKRNTEPLRATGLSYLILVKILRLYYLL